MYVWYCREIVDAGHLLPLDPLGWRASNFSIQYKPWITHKGKENKGNDLQLKKLLIVIHILLVSALRNVCKTVWRISILMSVCKGLMVQKWFLDDLGLKSSLTSCVLTLVCGSMCQFGSDVTSKMQLVWSNGFVCLW